MYIYYNIIVYLNFLVILGDLGYAETFCFIYSTFEFNCVKLQLIKHLEETIKRNLMFLVNCTI